MNGTSLGSVEFGQTLVFGVSNRASDGTAIAGFTPAYFDVLDPTAGTTMLSNQTLTQITSHTIYRGTIDTSINSFVARKTYIVKVKATNATDPATFMVFNFTVTGSYSDRLARLLALDGENVFIDNHTYDGGGNMTGCRVRVFNTKANAEAASSGNTDLEPGELYVYDVTQTFSTGIERLRSHLSTLSTSLEAE